MGLSHTWVRALAASGTYSRVPYFPCISRLRGVVSLLRL